METNTFTYGGVNSSKFGITYDTETHSLLPQQRKYFLDVPGYDGEIDFGIGGYGVRNITMKLYYDGNYSDFRKNREKMMAWLASSGGQAKQLILGEDPTKYYKAKIINAFDFKNANDGQIGAVVFECNPPWQFCNGVELTPEYILWNNQDNLEGTQWYKSFRFPDDDLRITNSGSPVKPIIKLYGNISTNTIISVGSQCLQFISSFRNVGILIDSKNETVTNVATGENLYPYVHPQMRDFFTLPHGKVEIQIATSKSIGDFPNNIVMIVEFDPVKGVE